MSSNRPFLSNFLAAFRAHSSAIPKAAPSLTTTSTSSTTQTVWSSTQQTSQLSTVSSPRAISDARKAVPSQTNRQPSPGPTPNFPAFSPPLQHNVSPLTHTRSPPSPGATVNGLPVQGPSNRPPPEYPTPQERGNYRHRRGSDSSSDGGFRDVSRAGGERWYIGGRTAGGEERYYKLSMVRRDTSSDRLSADRLSL
ncbi:hypothetical protein MBLNU457_1845t1 [Dothideomycetes sp. NU457]